MIQTHPTQCGSHLHFSSLLVEGAEQSDIPAPRCQEAWRDGGDGRLCHSENRDEEESESRQIYRIKIGAADTVCQCVSEGGEAKMKTDS